MLGGVFTGDAQVDNWLHNVPPTQPGKGRRDEFRLSPRPGLRPRKTKKRRSGSPAWRAASFAFGCAMFRSLRWRVHSMCVLIRLDDFVPWDLLMASSKRCGGARPRDADLSFALSVAPPPHPAQRELPMTAQLQGKYRAVTDSLELKRFNLTTPASKVQASGTLATPSTLHVSVSTSNLEEWRPLVTALGGPTNLPFRVDGNASFNGVVGGTFSSPTVAGTLVAEDFEFTVPATSRTPEKPVHWDSLAVERSIFPSRTDSPRRHVASRRNQRRLRTQRRLCKKENSPKPAPYTARVNLHNVDVASTAALAGFDYPVSGTADVSLQIAGTRFIPQVQGHIHAVNASAYQEAIEHFDADLRIPPNRPLSTFK